MISEDKPLTVNWTYAPAGERRDGATFEVARSESLGVIEDALGDGTRILAYARIRIAEAADPGDVEVLPGSAPGASGRPIVAVGCSGGFLHFYVGVEDGTAMMSVLTHDIALLSVPCP